MANAYTAQSALVVPFHGPSLAQSSAGAKNGKNDEPEDALSIVHADSLMVSAAVGPDLSHLYELLEAIDQITSGAAPGSAFQAMMSTRLATAAAAHIRPEDVHATDPRRFKPEEAFVPDPIRLAAADLESSPDAPKRNVRNVLSLAATFFARKKKREEEKNYYAPRMSRFSRR